MCQAPNEVISSAASNVKANTIPVNCLRGDGVQGTAVVVQTYVLDTSSGSQFEMSLQPFDPATAALFFSFALTTTVSFWALCYGIGRVVEFVRSKS